MRAFALYDPMIPTRRALHGSAIRAHYAFIFDVRTSFPPLLHLGWEVPIPFQCCVVSMAEFMPSTDFIPPATLSLQPSLVCPNRRAVDLRDVV